MEVIQIYTDSPLRNYSYLIVSEDKKNVICVDPWSAGQILDVLAKRGLDLGFIVNTHDHWDHTKGNQKLKAQTGAKILAHSKSLGISDVDEFLALPHKLKFSKEEWVEFFDTPGHTDNHFCLMLASKNPFAVITGDTLFNAGVGNCKNGGDAKVLYATISQKFKNLSDEILIYPGHDYLENNLNFTLSIESDNLRAKELLSSLKKDQHNIVTSMKLEREINTFLRLEILSEKSSGLDRVKDEFSTEEDLFIALRNIRDKW